MKVVVGSKFGFAGVSVTRMFVEEGMEKGEISTKDTVYKYFFVLPSYVKGSFALESPMQTNGSMHFVII
jgi:hypothetical protein